MVAGKKQGCKQGRKKHLAMDARNIEEVGKKQGCSKEASKKQAGMEGVWKKETGMEERNIRGCRKHRGTEVGMEETRIEERNMEGRNIEAAMDGRNIVPWKKETFR
jgi:hypothetical protein